MKDNDIKIFKTFANSDIDNYVEDNDSIYECGRSEGLFIDDNSKKGKKSRRKSFQRQAKQTFLDSVRNSSQFVNLVEDFKAKFSLDVIYKQLKEKRKFRIKEDMFLNLKLPKSRDLKTLSKDDDMNAFEKHLWQLEGENITISNHKVLTFVFLVSVHFSYILVCN